LRVTLEPWRTRERTPRRANGSGTITFLGRTFDVAAPPAGMAPGEDALRSIPVSRATQCSRFLAQPLLIHFVTARFTSADLDDVAATIRSSGFDLRAVLKTLLTSRFFHSAENRFALVEGPVSWAVRAARALGRSLAAADALPVKRFPAWSNVAASFDQAGMKLLDPSGPNGWKEDVAWLNSNTVRFRTRLAAAIALGAGAPSGSSDQLLFPSDPATWFPAAPASAAEVLSRLVALLQPGPIPSAVSDAWLAVLWPSTFAWDGSGPTKARELAYLILCSPAGQLH
jgi:hypothetical protein